MKLQQVINNSYYTANGYVHDENSLELLESYILYNLEVLQEFKGIVVATTYKQYPELVQANADLWKKYFPNAVMLDIPINRGHSFGIADSENAIVDYCKEQGIDWICKSSNDVIIQQSILDKQVQPADLYYLNGIGVGGMAKYNYDFGKIIEQDFYPQTNFYLLNVSKIDYLYGKQYVDETYEYIKSLSSYNGKVWEYVEGWSCEDFLKRCVQRNKLQTHHLIPTKNYVKLLTYIRDNNIHDCSHKNIVVEGVCHFQFPNEPVIQI